MSFAVCVNQHLRSDNRGTRFAPAWFPQLLAERFEGSKKDGKVEHTPDPIPQIDTTLAWTNNTDAAIWLWINLTRASRSIITSNTNMLLMQDALSWDIGLSPDAGLPQVGYGDIGIRIKKTPFASTELEFARYFTGHTDGMVWVQAGVISPGDSIEVRYQCLLSTPGQFRVWDSGIYDAKARWVRLQLWGAPDL